MQGGRCLKRYPRALTEQTMSGENGYPLYRRRSHFQGGFMASIRIRGQEILLDKNGWYRIRQFQPMIALRNRNEYDEVTRYQNSRYISSSEAVWRILSFPIHERHPPVIHLLDVHLEGRQRVYFQTENICERLANPRQTTLLKFFRLCERDHFGKYLLYNEVPCYYTHNKQQGIFLRRSRGTAVDSEPGILKST